MPNFQNEAHFLREWKTHFNAYIFNDNFLKIIYVKSMPLNTMCSLSKKDKLYFLEFKDKKLATLAFNELSNIALNWKKKLNGTTIEIEMMGHTAETKLVLVKLIKNFFQVQKNSLQAKRNKLLKNPQINKKELDLEIKTIEALMNPSFSNTLG